MEDFEKIKVAKDTQKFVGDLADLPSEKYHKVMGILGALEKQQDAEARLENGRGWRYMWQRTPKPYLLMLGYLVFLAPVGSFGYHAMPSINEGYQLIFLAVLSTILLLPLLVVFYLSYHYVKQENKDRKQENNTQTNDMLTENKTIKPPPS